MKKSAGIAEQRLKMMKPKILHIITHLPVGGAQDNTLITLEGLDKAQYDLTLLCGPSGEWMDRAQRIPGVRVVFMKELVRPIHCVFDVIALFKMVRLMRREQYDLVHTHSSKPGFSGRIAARMARVPVVVHTVHGFPFHDFMPAWKKAFFVGIERALAPLAHKLITVSRLNMQKALALKIGKPAQYINIYSGIDFRRFDDALALNPEAVKQSLGIGPDRKVVGMVGRLSHQKAPKYFLEAVPRILEFYPDTLFVFIGDGELRHQLEKTVKARGLEQAVRFLGVREDVPAMLSMLDVFVLTSLWEGLGRSLTEAMYMARPVVATGVEGVPELVEDRKTGYLVEPKDPEAVARAVTACLKHPDKAKEMGERARSRVRHLFDGGRMVAEIHKLYQALLQNRGR